MSRPLIIYSPDLSTTVPLPYADGGVRAGFPSPAQDYLDRTLDLNSDLIHHPAATFYARVQGDSMTGAGIDEGDVLIIDRALDPEDNDIVVAFINGEFTIKYIDLSQRENGVIWLRPANDSYPAFKITPDDEFTVWGVVANVIKRLKK